MWTFFDRSLASRKKEAVGRNGSYRPWDRIWFDKRENTIITRTPIHQREYPIFLGSPANVLWSILKKPVWDGILQRRLVFFGIGTWLNHLTSIAASRGVEVVRTMIFPYTRWQPVWARKPFSKQKHECQTIQVNEDKSISWIFVGWKPIVLGSHFFGLEHGSSLGVGEITHLGNSVIHVAGTNGGSTICYLVPARVWAGLRVGVFTSLLICLMTDHH